MSTKDIHYSGGVVAESDGTRFDTQARLRAIGEAADIVYKNFGDGTIGLPEFDRQMNRLESDRAAVDQERRNSKAVAKWAGSADSSPNGGFSGASRRPLHLRDKRGAPPLLLDDIQVKSMWDCAQSRTPTAMRVKGDMRFNAQTKDFNTAEGLLPPQLAPFISAWLYEKRIAERLPSIAVDAPSYEIIRDPGTRTGAAAVVSEGAQKPEIVLAPEAITLPMRKLACHLATSWEVISDHDRYLQYLQRTLPLEIIAVENQQILYGLGDAYNELLGFANTPGILHKDVGFADDVSALDAVEEAIEEMREQPGVFAVPDLFITSPSSWSALRRIKDGFGRYYLSPDPSQGQGNQLWGVPVITTTAVPPNGDGFLIDTSLFGAILVRESLVVRQGLSEDDFVRNLVRWVAEERLAVAVEWSKAILRLENLPTTPQSS